MSEPTLYRETSDPNDPLPPRGAMHRDTPPGSRLAIANAYAVGRLVEVVPVEPDIKAMATVMNVDGWTCDGHEPGAWCEDCKRLQLSTAQKMWCAGIGGDDE